MFEEKFDFHQFTFHIVLDLFLQKRSRNMLVSSRSEMTPIGTKKQHVKAKITLTLTEPNRTTSFS